MILSVSTRLHLTKFFHLTVRQHDPSVYRLFVALVDAHLRKVAAPSLKGIKGSPKSSEPLVIGDMHLRGRKRSFSANEDKDHHASALRENPSTHFQHLLQRITSSTAKCKPTTASQPNLSPARGEEKRRSEPSTSQHTALLEAA